jgi:hypothetical protein
MEFLSTHTKDYLDSRLSLLFRKLIFIELLLQNEKQKDLEI